MTQRTRIRKTFYQSMPVYRVENPSYKRKGMVNVKNFTHPKFHFGYEIVLDEKCVIQQVQRGESTQIFSFEH